jgi:hypothetical protein
MLRFAAQRQRKCVRTLAIAAGLAMIDRRSEGLVVLARRA